MTEATTISVPTTWATNPVLNSIARVALLMAGDPSLSIPQLMGLTGEGRRTVERARKKLADAGLLAREVKNPGGKLLRYNYTVV